MGVSYYSHIFIGALETPAMKAKRVTKKTRTVERSMCENGHQEPAQVGRLRVKYEYCSLCGKPYGLQSVSEDYEEEIDPYSFYEKHGFDILASNRHDDQWYIGYTHKELGSQRDDNPPVILDTQDMFTWLKKCIVEFAKQGYDATVEIMHLTTAN